MSFHWNAEVNSASWHGADLTFRAETDAGEVRYLIRAHRLRGAAQRTSVEALSLNLPLLRETLVRLATGARPGQTLTLD